MDGQHRMSAEGEAGGQKITMANAAAYSLPGPVRKHLLPNNLTSEASGCHLTGGAAEAQWRAVTGTKLLSKVVGL